ncbi:hypothetical protein CONCODRAFT_7743 [Conidiobolus coronatus NRRL 28638]|uniref:Uncharacterized protein n=1 Tax=Conidiobolus coronatus (strain ATCC 28846 / CBS 209.66 / NRRL 28638) TaxID=796925 RepID=A0A137P450_CONC2|nr:hypothetical protein CONCODRAFT_7743 [Conidiobolus coronatus NRRL 28638]|eukprot:KXN69797.1 hypothetical protein CONCODRAFT_7743 [Conidiobolus coronatus NRRL 28638]
MKYRLLTCILICSIASLPPASNGLTSVSNGKNLNLRSNLDNFSSSIEDSYSYFGSPSQFNQEGSYDQNNLRYEDGIDTTPTSQERRVKDGGDSLDTREAENLQLKIFEKQLKSFIIDLQDN